MNRQGATIDSLGDKVICCFRFVDRQRDGQPRNRKIVLHVAEGHSQIVARGDAQQRGLRELGRRDGLEDSVCFTAVNHVGSKEKEDEEKKRKRKEHPRTVRATGRERENQKPQSPVRSQPQAGTPTGQHEKKNAAHRQRKSWDFEISPHKWQAQVRLCA